MLSAFIEMLLAHILYMHTLSVDTNKKLVKTVFTIFGHNKQFVIALSPLKTLATCPLWLFRKCVNPENILSDVVGMSPDFQQHTMIIRQILHYKTSCGAQMLWWTWGERGNRGCSICFRAEVQKSEYHNEPAEIITSLLEGSFIHEIMNAGGKKTCLCWELIIEIIL